MTCIPCHCNVLHYTQLWVEFSNICRMLIKAIIKVVSKDKKALTSCGKGNFFTLFSKTNRYILMPTLKSALQAGLKEDSCLEFLICSSKGVVFTIFSSLCRSMAVFNISRTVSDLALSKAVSPFWNPIVSLQVEQKRTERNL